MGRRILVGLLALLALLAATVAAAAAPKAVEEQVELSMLLTGSIVVEPDGRVSQWEIDRSEEVPHYVRDLVAKSAASWMFQPVLVDGEATKVRANMSLRVVAMPDGEDFRVTIRSSYFGADAKTPEERLMSGGTEVIRGKQLTPPRYPPDALRSGVRGTAYLVIRVDREGRTAEAFVEQVNLRTAGPERRMAQMRDLLGRAALDGARRWTWTIPTTGEDADRDYWTVRVPVLYTMGGEKKPGYGKWQAYIPGPLHSAPWSQGERRAGSSPDAMVAGVVYQEGRELVLLTPLVAG